MTSPAKPRTKPHPLRDYYDRAVRYFLAHPDQIGSVWEDPGDARHGQLFAFVSPNRRGHLGTQCGCPAMISNGGGEYFAYADQRQPDLELTRQLRADARLTVPNDQEPELAPAALREYLTAFAEWQRAIDARYHRDPPRDLPDAD